MPVVKKQSNLYRNPHDGDALTDPLMKAGRIIIATGSMANSVDDSNQSIYRLGEFPSYCLLHEDTFFDVENWGFAQVVIGTHEDPTALIDQLQSTEAVVKPIVIGDVFHGKRLWEILGLAQDPGGHIVLFAHATADATGAGNMPFRIVYIDN